MPRRKSFRKRYNKSKQTRRIRKMRKMKTRKLTRGGGAIAEWGTFKTNFGFSPTEVIGAIGSAVGRGAYSLAKIAYTKTLKHPEIVTLKYYMHMLEKDFEGPPGAPEGLVRLYGLKGPLPNAIFRSYFWAIERHLFRQYYSSETTRIKTMNREVLSAENRIYIADKCGITSDEYEELFKKENDEFKDLGSQVNKTYPETEGVKKLSTYYLYYETDIKQKVELFEDSVSNEQCRDFYKIIRARLTEWKDALTVVENSVAWKEMSRRDICWWGRGTDKVIQFYAYVREEVRSSIDNLIRVLDRGITRLEKKLKTGQMVDTAATKAQAVAAEVKAAEEIAKAEAKAPVAAPETREQETTAPVAAPETTEQGVPPVGGKRRLRKSRKTKK
jgi:hypothetical protein